MLMGEKKSLPRFDFLILQRATKYCLHCPSSLGLGIHLMKHF